MKLHGKLVLLSAASLLTTAAFADTVNSSMVPNIVASNVAPLNSIYVSGDAGYGTLSTPDENIPCIGDCDTSHSNGNFAGGLSVAYNRAILQNVLLGAEFGYDSNGQAKYTLGSFNEKITSQDFHLLATGTYLFTNGFDVFAKAGAARVDQKLKTSGDGLDGVGDTTDHEYQPMTAIGAGYQIKQFNIYVQYAHIFGKDPSDFSDLYNTDGSFKGTVSADTFKAGLGYTIAI